MLLSGNAAERFPPAGGMGDWGLPQQARLSYKRYACASVAQGGVDYVVPRFHLLTPLDIFARRTLAFSLM